MKKTILICSVCIISLAGTPLLAQPEKKVEKKTEEIIIKQNGDKQMNLTVQIDGDKVTVNGKPLAEFKDDNVSINKRKMIISDGSKTMQFNFGNSQDMFEKMMDNNDAESTNTKAFLGVVTNANEQEDGGKITKGAIINSITKESAAEKAGLKIGDVITMINDKPVEDPETLAEAVGWYKPNDEVTIKYIRAGKIKKIKAKLGQRKISRKQSFSFNNNGDGGSVFTIPSLPNSEFEGNMQQLEQRLNGLNNDIAPLQNFSGNIDGNFDVENFFPRQKKLGLKIQDIEDGDHVKIIGIEDSSAAAIAGLQKDDIITEIDGKKINNTDDAREQLVPQEGKKLYQIKILRNKQEMNIDVKIPRKLKTANL
jgi:serine protease Do